MYLKILWENRKLVAVATCTLVLVSFYIYYLKTSHTIENLARQNAELQNVVEEQKQKLEQMQKNYEKIIAGRDELLKQIKESQQELDDLKNKLFRENHGKMSLEELAKKKPKLVEKIINKATEDTLNCFETLSQGKDCK